MKKLFAILPLFGALGFFWGAYMFFMAGKISGGWSYIAVGVFVVCGLGFLIWALGVLLQTKDESVSYSEGQALKTSGTKITAAIAHLEQITNIRINNRSPYVIHAKGVNAITGQEQIFKSFWLWSDPFTQAQAGRGIDVYLDKFNPLKYYLDVESIGLPAEQTRSNFIAKLAVIIPIIILLVGGIIAFAALRNNGNYFDSIKNAQDQAAQSWSTQDDETTKCMKQLYGEDVLEKMIAGKFVPPADMSEKMRECALKKNNR